MTGQTLSITNNLLHFFIYTFMAIFPIANPIGMSPFFLSLTKNYSPKIRREIAIKVTINSFFIYSISLLAGSWILAFFKLSIPVVKVAGGLVVYFAALEMLNSKPKISAEEEKETLGKHGDIVFFPLTMPITAGAGSLAIAIAIGAGIVGGDFVLVNYASQLLGAILGIAALAVTIFVCYFSADRIFAKIGRAGTDMVTRISSFLLLAVSVEVIWDGVRSLILTSLH